MFARIGRLIVWLLLQVRALYPVRFSLLFGAMLPALVPLALWGARPLLLGLFVLERPIQLMNVTWISLLAATMVLVTYRVTLINTPYRLFDFRGPNWRQADGAVVPAHGWRGRWVLFFACGMAVPLACAYATCSDPPPEWGPFTGVLPGDRRVILLAVAALGGGVVWGLALLGVLTAFQQLLLSPDLRSPDLLPFEAWEPFRAIKAVRVKLLHRTWAAPLWFGSWPGYVQSVQDRETRQRHLVLRPGHAQLALCAVALLVTYLASYVLGGVYRWIPDGRSGFPGLFFVLLPMLLLSCVLPGLAFFLDYYRIPVVLMVTGLAAVMYWFQGTDHFYAVERAAEQLGGPPVDVEQTLLSRTYPPGADGRRTLVVVAAAGGGIQAAAWTTQVLTGLHQRYGNPFTRSIGLISGVSGGSVGTLFYLVHRADFAGPAPTTADLLPPLAIARARIMARDSSLEATGWGVAYPDLIRILLPVLARPHVDRGWAVEQDWRRRMNRAGIGLGSTRLSDLLEGIQTRGMPVVVFNATVVETGQRLLIAPVSAGPRSSVPGFAQPREFRELYPGVDMYLSTAARLSATFPYVSPICRPDAGPVDETVAFHVADGGYADNDGIVTAIDWLQRLVERTRSLPRDQRPFDRVILVRIQPFPTGRAPHAPARNRGWLYAVAGPLLTMTNVRVASQSERGNLEVELWLGSSAATSASSSARIARQSVAFVYPASDDDDDWIPLSWKLTPRQQRAMDAAWATVLQDAGSPRSPLTVLDSLFGRTASTP